MAEVRGTVAQSSRLFCANVAKDSPFWRQEEGERPREEERPPAMDPGDRVWRERGLQAAVLAGDVVAWQHWYDVSFADLHAYVAWRCAGLSEPTEDIVQETWLTAVRKLASFRPEQGSFAGWLRGIAAKLLQN